MDKSLLGGSGHSHVMSQNYSLPYIYVEPTTYLLVVKVPQPQDHLIITWVLDITFFADMVAPP